MTATKQLLISLSLLFAALSANAATMTSKLNSFGVSYPAGTDTPTYTVRIGTNNYMSTSKALTAELLQEAFLRKLTVTIQYEQTGQIPNYGIFGNIIAVTIQASDLP